jgi:hypothetical protein
MPAIKVSISDIKSAISKAQSKVDEASASDTNKRVLDSQIRAANDRVKSSEAAVTSSEMTKQQAEDKLSPPPTKQIASDGKKGGSKTVVDEAEKDKLQAQVKAADVQINQAKQTVGDAKAQAEALTAQALGDAGVSSDQQKSMSDLSNLMAQLKSMANDPQTNMEGDAFQDKLKTAVDKIGVLEKSLPNVANTQLADFWKEVTAGMTTVQDKFIKATTPEAYKIVAGDKSKNYAEFFEDYNQGMTTLIDRLSKPGADGSAPIIDATAKQFLQDAQIGIAKHSPNSPDAKFLGAFNATDEGKMTNLMDQVNTLINNVNKSRPITADDISKLINDSKGLDTRLAGGGGDFAALISTEFNTMGAHATSIARNLNRSGQTDDLDDFSKAAGRVNQIANPNNFKGLTDKDHKAIDALGERLRAMDKTLSEGGSVPDNVIRTLIDDTNTLVDTLSDHYGLSTPNSNNNSSGFGSGVGSGSNSWFASSSIR